MSHVKLSIALNTVKSKQILVRFQFSLSVAITVRQVSKNKKTQFHINVAGESTPRTDIISGKRCYACST